MTMEYFPEYLQQFEFPPVNRPKPNIAGIREVKVSRVSTKIMGMMSFIVSEKITNFTKKETA